MKFKRNCPECQRDIFYKGENAFIHASELMRLCKSCTQRNVRYQRTHEQNETAKESRRLTMALKPKAQKEQSRLKQQISNLETWSKELLQAFVSNCLNNPSWHAKLKKPKICLNPEQKSRKIVESKVKMSFDDWQIVRSEYEKYASKVRTITNRQPLSTLENYGKGSSYHLDHKFSVAEGFRRGVEPKLIGSIVNLRYVTAQENLAKRDKCSVTLEELLFEIEILNKKDN